jgi:hypothetical protein
MQGADGRFSMSAAQQKGDQHHGDDGAGGTRLTEHGRQQAFTAFDQQRALTVSLMEQVCDPKNLVRAYRRVYSNKGKPGVDGMTVHELADWLRKHSAALTASLLDGTYRPQPVRGVSIPKPGGGQRQLGIPVEFLFQKPSHRFHHPLPCRQRPHVDVAVVGVTAEAMAPAVQ